MAVTSRLFAPWILLTVFASGCGLFGGGRAPRPPAAAAVEINNLAERLKLNVSRPSATPWMVVMSGPRGTVVINPRTRGIWIRNVRCFSDFQTVVADGRVTVPAGFLEECEKRLGPAGVVGVVGPPVAPPMTSIRVVIDAGHGGHDPGALGVSGASEKSVNLGVARLIAFKLQAAGVNVTMTRSGDTFVELNERAAIGNRLGADAFVSIHADSSGSRSTRGFTVFVVHSNYSDAERAREIGGESALRGSQLTAALSANRARSQRLASLIRAQLARATDSPDRGTQPGEFRVLKRSVCPAVLVELGFMSNPSEEQSLLEYEYQDRLATAIASGVIMFVRGR